MTTAALAPYDVTVTDGLFTVNVPFLSYAVSWDRVFAHALARLDYVAGTHLIPPDSDAFPYRLVVSVNGDLTWARIEEMQTVVDTAYATNGA